MNTENQLEHHGKYYKGLWLVHYIKELWVLWSCRPKIHILGRVNIYFW